MTTQSDAYSALLKTIRSLPLTGTTAIPAELMTNQEVSASAPLRQEDYPNIKFWFKRQWIGFSNDHLTNAISGPQARGRSRAAQGINVTMQYVELEDGTIISGDRATEIRKFARAIWVSFSKAGTPPSKWGQADIQTRQQYLHAMGSHFTELRLCDLEWKAEQIATNNYPSWYTNWLSKRDVQDLKQENDDVPSLQTKRSRKASAKFAAKRTKLEGAVISDDKGENCKVAPTLDIDIDMLGAASQVGVQCFLLSSLYM